MKPVILCGRSFNLSTYKLLTTLLEVYRKCYNLELCLRFAASIDHQPHQVKNGCGNSTLCMTVEL